MNNTNEIFAHFAKDYDKQNDIFSFFLHKVWKKQFVNLTKNTNKADIIDLAAGTLDISILLAKKYSNKIIALDICPEMLEYGYSKLDAEQKKQIECLVADATKLSYQSNSLGLATISFGIRNMQPRAQALQEIHRVLMPNAQLAILEFAPLTTPIIKQLYNFYLSKIMPILAGLISKSKGSYNYFADSILNFPSANDFKKELENAGFTHVSYKKLTFGIAVIYLAYKRDA